MTKLVFEKGRKYCRKSKTCLFKSLSPFATEFTNASSLRIVKGLDC